EEWGTAVRERTTASMMSLPTHNEESGTKARTNRSKIIATVERGLVCHTRRRKPGMYPRACLRCSQVSSGPEARLAITHKHRPKRMKETNRVRKWLRF